MARDCEVKRSTATGFAEILEDLLIASTLPVFSMRAKRHMASRRKFYFFDCGVFRSSRPTGPLDAPSEIDGAALETLVYQHLRAVTAYSQKSSELYYWSTKSGVEVDFVIYGEAGFLSVEVKNTRKVRPMDTTSSKHVEVVCQGHVSFVVGLDFGEELFFGAAEEEEVIEDQELWFCPGCQDGQLFGGGV